MKKNNFFLYLFLLVPFKIVAMDGPIDMEEDQFVASLLKDDSNPGPAVKTTSLVNKPKSPVIQPLLPVQLTRQPHMQIPSAASAFASPYTQMQPQIQQPEIPATSNSSNSGSASNNQQVMTQQQIAHAAIAQNKKRKNPEPHAKVTYSVAKNEQTGHLIFKRQKLDGAKSSSSVEVEKKSEAEAEKARQELDTDEAHGSYVQRSKKIKFKNFNGVHLCPAPKCFLKFDSRNAIQSHYVIHTTLRSRLTENQAKKLDVFLEQDPNKSKDPKDYKYLKAKESQCPVPSCQIFKRTSNMWKHVMCDHLKKIMDLPYKCGNCGDSFHAPSTLKDHKKSCKYD
jgi:hypothetical protein